MIRILATVERDGIKFIADLDTLTREVLIRYDGWRLSGFWQDDDSHPDLAGFTDIDNGTPMCPLDDEDCDAIDRALTIALRTHGLTVSLVAPEGI